MKMQEALDIMALGRVPGYMVSFERIEGHMLFSDHFPDKLAGEALIPTEEKAWGMAAAFAKATVGECVNIKVIGSDFVPVEGWKERMIKNRL